MEAIAVLDIGTSSVRAGLYDLQARPVPRATASRMAGITTTPDGQFTIDAEELARACLECLAEAAGQSDQPLRVLAVGTATFWHSMVGVDSAGQALTPVYIWADSRSTAQVARLRQDLDERAVHRRTGCRFHTSYLPARLLWLRETAPGLYRDVAAWISPGEYVHARILGQRLCSVSMASGTGLLNQEGCDWDRELLEYLGLDAGRLPAIAPDEAFLSATDRRTIPGLSSYATAAWYPAWGDGACSSLGAAGVGRDRMTLALGTSGALRILGEIPDAAPRGLWKYRLDRANALVGGAISNGGIVYEWLRRTLNLPDDAATEEWLRSAVPDSHGLTVLPFLTGERSPDWPAGSGGAIVGLTAATTPLQIVQASMEAVAYRMALIYRLLFPLAALDHRIIAGGVPLVRSAAWARMFADVLGRPVTLIQDPECTARGTAILTLHRLGVLPEMAAIEPGRGQEIAPDRHTLYRSGLERYEEAITH